MITAYEEGRSLILVVAEGSEDELRFTIKPLSVKDGTEIFAQFCGIVFGESPDTAADEATDFAKRAVGEENFIKLDVLRYAEANEIINAAFMWNVQGGGIDLVQEMLSDGLPKARETLFSSNGLGAAYSALTTLLSMASENPTSVADTPDTSTRSGFEKQSKTANRLPPAKRSIRQNG